jgi:hypothetical protein
MRQTKVGAKTLTEELCEGVGRALCGLGKEEVKAARVAIGEAHVQTVAYVRAQTDAVALALSAQFGSAMPKCMDIKSSRVFSAGEGDCRISLPQRPVTARARGTTALWSKANA